LIGVRPEIGKLAELVFDPEELSYVEVVAEAMRFPRKGRRQAVALLREIMPQRPKRPLSYARYSLGRGPMEARYTVERMGRYLGKLVKELRFEFEGKYPEGSSFRVDISRLLKNKGNMNSDLEQLLKKIRFLDKVAYVPSKHKDRPPDVPQHYFSVSDGAIVVLAAVKLGEELKKRSKYVRNLCQDLVDVGQRPIIGSHPRTDDYGELFDFKEKLKAEVLALEEALRAG